MRERSFVVGGRLFRRRLLAPLSPGDSNDAQGLDFTSALHI